MAGLFEYGQVFQSRKLTIETDLSFLLGFIIPKNFSKVELERFICNETSSPIYTSTRYNSAKNINENHKVSTLENVQNTFDSYGGALSS